MTRQAPLPQPLISFDSDQACIEALGGKGANLVKLTSAGLPVPNGFLIPTDAYRQFVAQNQLMPQIKDTLAGLDFISPHALEMASETIRGWFASGYLSPSLITALEAGWRWLGKNPVAVRSSATAEDLPDLSFAGQQDTFLNIMGIHALQKAVVDCWSSLWTARAIGYRARNHISHELVALCVVVQNMVQSEAAGVLFTANPLSGRRTETVIDATLGLGEALVSGLVEPDHYVVDTLQNAITQKSLGSKSIQVLSKPDGGVSAQAADSSNQQAIPDHVILQLAKIGSQIEALYKFPQDIEWAVAQGEIHILQSRPITSLYPLPNNLPPVPLKTLVGLHVIQGVMEPFTPLGQSAIMEVLIGGGRTLGLNLTLEEQTAFYVAGERVWINVTPIIRHPRGHEAYPIVFKNIDPGVAQTFEEILRDPRLAPQPGSMRLLKPGNILRFVLPNLLRVLHFMRAPEEKARQTLETFDARVAETRSRQQSSGDLATDFSQRVDLLLEARNLFADFVIPNGVTAVVAGMIPFFGVLRRFSSQLAEYSADPQFETLYLEIARGLPNNVTTQMDLSLWQTAQKLQADAEVALLFKNTAADDLADQFMSGSLPPEAQSAISEFLARYGMRGLGEIDIGRPRWVEDPEHIIGVLQSYLRIEDPALAPDAVFARGEQASQSAAQKLETAVRQLPRGWFKAHLVRFAVRRYRALGGLREAPKFFAIRMMGIMRMGLLESGEQMVAAGFFEQADDLFFLHVAELKDLADQFANWKAGDLPPACLAALRLTIKERRTLREREMRRAQIPRVLLSDGTAYFEGLGVVNEKEGQFFGDPVSPGVAEGTVRVVLNPLGAQLQPGEILVCPGTDPAWTPLFLAAGGLVMETGGMMTHGSVVAREYGIPAVVGVHQATTRLHTGDRIRVDGRSGLIEVIPTNSQTSSFKED